MLANHYFLIRNFQKACAEFENLLSHKGKSKEISKKLIVCYIASLQIEKAFIEFYKLINEDLCFITRSDFNLEDCPCPKIIYQIENDIIKLEIRQKYLALGMLWLYSEINKSLEYFQKLAEGTEDKRINEVYYLIKSQTLNNQKSTGDIK